MGKAKVKAAPPAVKKAPVKTEAELNAAAIASSEAAEAQYKAEQAEAAAIPMAVLQAAGITNGTPLTSAEIIARCRPLMG